jgi:hypothetical protein
MNESRAAYGDQRGRTQVTHSADVAGKALRYLYAALNAVFWAAGGIMVGILIFAVANFSKLQDSRANFEREQAAAISTENRTFCESVGLHQGTDQHSACMRDLDVIRARHERRILEDSQGLL